MFYSNPLNRELRYSVREKGWKVIRGSHDYLAASASINVAVIIPDLNNHISISIGMMVMSNARI